jgi:hypothetical protein
MKQIARTTILSLLLSLTCAFAGPVTLSIPGSSIGVGLPGSTVGWGYTIDNQTSFFLLVDGSNFCGPGGDPQFTDCSGPYNGTTNFGPSLGVYNDIIATNVTVIAPNSTSTVFYDGTHGLGSYTIDGGASVGATDPSIQTSTLFVSYMPFSGDPFTGGAQAGPDTEVSASASVLVGAATVPEPSTLTFAFGSLLGLVAMQRQRLFKK